MLKIIKDTKAGQIIALSAIILYVILASRHINLPGIQYDEVLQVPASIVFLKGDANGHYNRFGSTRIAGHFFILMNMEYIGALRSYILLIPFRIFGIRISVYRLTNIAITALALLFTYLFAKAFFGVTASLIGLWLTATDPSLIMLTRLDWGPVVLAFLFRISSLFFLLKWWQSGGKTRFLVIAGALLGLGVYDKTNFMWFVMALIAVGAIAWWIDDGRPRISFLGLLSASGAGLITSIPLWIYNLKFGWLTFKMLNEGRRNMPLSSLIGLIPRRTRILVDWMNGMGPDRLMFGESLPGSLGWFRTLLLPLALFSLVVLISIAVKKKEWRLLFIPLLAVLIAIQTYLTPLPIGMHHWTMISPFPHLVVGAACGRANQWLKEWRYLKPVILSGFVLLICAVGMNLNAMSGYYDLMQRTGGTKHWSSEINNLSTVLKAQYPGRQIQLMDWGLGNTLFCLSEGELYTHEPFWAYTKSSEPDEELLKMVKDSSNVFVLNAPEGTSFPEARKAFYKAVSRSGVEVLREQKINDRRSNWVYSILELSKPK